MSRQRDIRVEVWRDECVADPREMYTPASVMVCFHNRLNLGDKTKYRSEDFNGWDGLKEQLEKDYNIHTILPVYMYAHSGYALSTTPFSCPWDSGQVGWIFMTLEHIAEPGIESTAEKVTTVLKEEISEYSSYINGEVYGYSVEELQDNGEWTRFDNCHGCYGLDSLYVELKALKERYGESLKKITYKDSIPEMEE